MTEEKVLPNPEVIRLPIVPDCLSALIYEDEKDPKKNVVRPDCNKIFTHPDGTQVCITYADPSGKWRLGCGLASNKINIATQHAKIRVGQQKQKKGR